MQAESYSDVQEAHQWVVGREKKKQICGLLLVKLMPEAHIMAQNPNLSAVILSSVFVSNTHS